MAFGRSNSLSINTGATNSLFASQQPASSQPAPPATASLFGAPKPGGLFGSTATSQAPATSMFGATSNAANNSQSTFGGTAPQQQPSNTNALSMFGGSTQQQQPQAQSGGLFGSTLGQNQGQTTQLSGGSLFGSTFGQNKPAGGLNFGGLGQTQANNQPAAGTSLFGGGLNSQNGPAGGSIFGAANTQQQPQLQQQQRQQAPSLLANTLFNASTQAPTPFAGGLTLGQPSTLPQVQPGVKIDVSNLRPTTRFSDLHDDLKRALEHIDALVRQQEAHASQCEALAPSHGASVASLSPDVELIASRAETVELALENDSALIAAAKRSLGGDVRDLARCARLVDNLSLPARFHYGPHGNAGAGGGNNNNNNTNNVDDGAAQQGGGIVRGRAAPAIAAAAAALGDDDTGGSDYDVDLAGYFSRAAADMEATARAFARNLGEIEAHLGVVERSAGEAVAAALEHSGAGGGGGASGHRDTVRELADTLKGFEGGILDAAGRVGGVREGVNGLVLGRAGF